VFIAARDAHGRDRNFWRAGVSFACVAGSGAGIAVVASLLGYEHSLVKVDELSKLDAAFFTVKAL